MNFNSMEQRVKQSIPTLAISMWSIGMWVMIVHAGESTSLIENFYHNIQTLNAQVATPTSSASTIQRDAIEKIDHKLKGAQEILENFSRDYAILVKNIQKTSVNQKFLLDAAENICQPINPNSRQWFTNSPHVDITLFIWIFRDASEEDIQDIQADTDFNHIKSTFRTSNFQALWNRLAPYANQQSFTADASEESLEKLYHEFAEQVLQNIKTRYLLVTPTASASTIQRDKIEQIDPNLRGTIDILKHFSTNYAALIHELRTKNRKFLLRSSAELICAAINPNNGLSFTDSLHSDITVFIWVFRDASEEEIQKIHSDTDFKQIKSTFRTDTFQTLWDNLAPYANRQSFTEMDKQTLKKLYNEFATQILQDITAQHLQTLPRATANFVQNSMSSTAQLYHFIEMMGFTLNPLLTQLIKTTNDSKRLAHAQECLLGLVHEIGKLKPRWKLSFATEVEYLAAACWVLRTQQLVLLANDPTKEGIKSVFESKAFEPVWEALQACIDNPKVLSLNDPCCTTAIQLFATTLEKETRGWSLQSGRYS